MSKIRAFSTLCLLFTSSFAVADNGTWSAVNQSQRSSIAQQKSGLFYRVDSIKLRQQLSRAMHEGRSEVTSQIELPVKNGSIQKFYIEESPIMAAGLAAKYPDTKTYKIRGIDNPYDSGRLSISPQGFHGMITGPSGTYYIDPESDGLYRGYRKNDQLTTQPFNCDVKGHTHDTPLGDVASRPANRTAGSLRVYRLAVAATEEYVSAVGGTRKAHDEIVIAINRVNQIYQRDLGIKLELVNNNDNLLETNSLLPKPYSNFNEFAMLGENQQNIDAVIGSSNYHIGHVFGTGGGGIAEVGSVCSSVKAGGVTGLSNPTGDAFYIDYVAHEIGHQFSAEHSFNGTEGSCGGVNRWQASAFEPGSGSSIMSYAGICRLENIVLHADAIFHAGSINQVDIFTTSGLGASCGSVLSVNNPAQPVAIAGNDYTIPAATPFRLTGSGTDADGDTLSYTWDQMDAGTQTDATTFGTDLGDNALMRSRLPQANPARHFPQLDTTLSSLEPDNAELLPTTNRDLHFRLTVRDGHSGIGREDVIISSVATAGPFIVTSHSSTKTLSGNTEEPLEWDVAATDSAPVNCMNVDVDLLMMNSDQSTYCEEPLASGIPNSGIASVTLPDLNIPAARFRVSCSNNIFYAISDGDLKVTGSSDANVSCKSVLPGIEEHEGVNLVVAKSSSSGGGSLEIYWLFSLLSMLVFRKTLYA